MEKSKLRTAGAHTHKCGSIAACDALRKALNDPHPYVAAFAAEQLFKRGESTDIHSLVKYLRPLRWFPYEIRYE